MSERRIAMNIVIVAILALVIGFAIGGLIGFFLASKAFLREKTKENNPCVNQVDLSIQYPILKLDLSQDYIIRDALGNNWTLVAAGTHACRVVDESTKRSYVWSYRDYAKSVTRQEFMTLFPEFAYLYQSASDKVAISKEEYDSLKPMVTAYKQAVQELERL